MLLISLQRPNGYGVLGPDFAGTRPPMHGVLILCPLQHCVPCYAMAGIKDKSSAAILDDFLGEEVLDRRGDIIGTLECYWETPGGSLLLGIKINEQVRVVPGAIAQVDERHSCVVIGAEAALVRSSAELECDQDLPAGLETRVHQHFAV